MDFGQGGIFNVPITCVTRDLGFYGVWRRFLRSRAWLFMVSGVGFYGLGPRFFRSRASVFTISGLGFLGLWCRFLRSRASIFKVSSKAAPKFWPSTCSTKKGY